MLTLRGIYNVSNAVQPENTFAFSVVTVDAISTLESALQSANNETGKVVIPSGIVIPVNPLLPAKLLVLKLVILSGIM